MNEDEFSPSPEDLMTPEELMALPGYVRPINEVLEEAKRRTAAYYSRGFAIIEPNKPDDDVIIVISRRR